MSEEATIKTVCSNCGMVYDLDRSLIGQMGECSGCGTAFEIADQTDYVNQMLAAQDAAAAPVEPETAAEPVEEAPAVEPEPAAEPVEEPAPAVEPETAPAPAPAPQEGDVVMKPEEDEESAPTNTVKLSRVSRAGMLPEIKDTPFKVGTINVSTQTVIGSTRGSRRFTARKFSSSRSSASSTPPARKKRWWEFWKK